jgi:hypothetical protein
MAISLTKMEHQGVESGLAELVSEAPAGRGLDPEDSTLRSQRRDPSHQPSTIERDAAVGFSGTVDRRDAAVAAALAGTVVVIVSYAAGLGIERSDAVAATEPPAAPSAPADPAQEQAPEAGAAPAAQPPAPVAPLAPSAPVPTSPPASPEASAPSQPATPSQPSPADPHSPHPSEPPPTPGEPTPSCAPGVLDDVPVVGPVTEAATSFLSALLGAVPVVDELADTLLPCALGAPEASLDEGTESDR